MILNHKSLVIKNKAAPYLFNCYLLKSSVIALLLTVFLGPVGLLYASVTGGIVMIIVMFIVLSVKLPVPIIVAWIICPVWAVLAVNKHNKLLFRHYEALDGTSN